MIMAQTGFHHIIDSNGPFPPEHNRYHLYIGLSCPFAHRVNLLRHIKGLKDIIPVSIARLRPKEDGIPEWVFSTEEDDISGATRDQVLGCTIVREIYAKLDPGYKGRFTVPLLIDTKTSRIVNNESAEMVRFLSTAFNPLLPTDLQKVTLYPESRQTQINVLSPLIQDHLAVGVYKSGFNPVQKTYEENLVGVFAMLNQLEDFLYRSGGPYLLGDSLTELDIILYPCLIRFDTVYHQHLKCNLGMIRYDYPVLHRYLQNLYWKIPGFRETTNFEHIKENYTKAHRKVNPTGITPLGPYPDIIPLSDNQRILEPGKVTMQRVVDAQIDLPVSV